MSNVILTKVSEYLFDLSKGLLLAAVALPTLFSITELLYMVQLCALALLSLVLSLKLLKRANQDDTQ